MIKNIQLIWKQNKFNEWINGDDEFNLWPVATFEWG